SRTGRRRPWSPLWWRWLTSITRKPRARPSGRRTGRRGWRVSKQPFPEGWASLQPLPGLPNHHAIIERGYLAGILEVIGPYQRGFSSGFNGRSVKELQEMVTGDMLPPYVDPADWPAWCREFVVAGIGAAAS